MWTILRLSPVINYRYEWIWSKQSSSLSFLSYPQLWVVILLVNLICYWHQLFLTEAPNRFPQLVTQRGTGY